MKKTIFKTLPLFLALTLSANDTYTVDDLILKAMENSPDLKTYAYEYSASQERFNMADANYLPVIDITVSGGEFGQSDVQHDNPDHMVNSSGIKGVLSVRQLLYDFGKTKNDVDYYKFDSESKSMTNEQQISNKIKDVKIAYYKVLQAVALIDVNKENVKLNEAQLYRSQRYYDAGIKTKIDVSDAKVQLIKSKLDLRQSEYNLKTAYANLDKVIGLTKPVRDYDVFVEQIDLSDLFSKLENYDLSLPSAIDFAYEHRYEIKQYIAQVKASQARSSQASSQFYPSLFLAGDYTKLKVDDSDLQENIPEDEWAATINLQWNLYEGGATTAAEQEKKIQLDISTSELLFKKLSIKQETTDAFINVNSTKDSVELSQSLLVVSSEKFDQASKRYENGLSDYIELQQARQGYIDAKASLVLAYYDYYSAIAVLDNAIGR
jgi:outer membrane protein